MRLWAEWTFILVQWACISASTPTLSEETNDKFSCEILRKDRTSEKNLLQTNDDAKGVAVDTSRNVLYSSWTDHRIRINDIDTGSTTLVIGDGSAGSSDGSYTAARFNSPRGIDFDPSTDVLFIADTGNHQIRGVDLFNQTVHTLAGHANASFWIDGDVAAARFSEPADIAFDAKGNTLYVADMMNNVIRAIDLANDVVTTIAGNGMGVGWTDGPSSVAMLAHPQFIEHLDYSLFVSYGNISLVQRIHLESEKVTRFLGSTEAGATTTTPVEDGPLSSAKFDLVKGLAADPRCSALYLSTKVDTRVVDLKSETVYLVFNRREAAAGAARIGHEAITFQELPDGQSRLFGGSPRTAISQLTRLDGDQGSGGRDGRSQAAVVVAVVFSILALIIVASLLRWVHSIRMRARRPSHPRTLPNFRYDDLDFEDHPRDGDTCTLRNDGRIAHIIRGDFAARMTPLTKYHSDIQCYDNLQKLFGTVTIPIRDEIRALVEYIPGDRLTQLHDRIDFTEPGRFARLAKDIFCGLDSMHKASLYHLGVACRNIIIREDGRAVLAYHRGCRFVDERAPVRITGKFALCWTAPEVFMTRRATRKADVWSFGITLWEIATKGGTPFRGCEDAKIKNGTASLEFPEDTRLRCALMYEMFTACKVADPEERCSLDDLRNLLAARACEEADAAADDQKLELAATAAAPYAASSHPGGLTIGEEDGGSPRPSSRSHSYPLESVAVEVGVGVFGGGNNDEEELMRRHSGIMPACGGEPDDYT